MKKVTISLTSEQQDKIRSETGEDVKSFTYESLESRDAPRTLASPTTLAAADSTITSDSGGDTIASDGADDTPQQQGGGRPQKL